MHVAILGCGQLSRMLALAGIPMGFTFSFIAEEGEDTRCVDRLGDVVVWGGEQSASDIYEALGRPDRLTVEKEQVDVELLQGMQPFCPVHPNPKAFAACQHRYNEKKLLENLSIPCAPFSYGQPENSDVALPVVVKSCRWGYDGKNQWVLKTSEDIEAFDPPDREEHYIVEKFIPFQREISQVSVRSVSGEIKHYPLAQNHHQDGILKQSVAPAPNISEQLSNAAQESIGRIMASLDYVGTMAMECFVVDDQTLLVNELAPRVHNSGHLTQAGSVTCQFENHIRALCELPLGSTESLRPAAMVNLLGTEKPPVDALTENASLHWYGKVVRPGRKLGHINVVDENYQSLLSQLEEIENNL